MPLTSRALLDQAIELAVDLIGKTPKGKLDDFQVVTFGFLVRGVRSARAAILCADAGLGEEALIHSRTIWEAAVTLEYVGRAPRERASRFLRYDAVARHNYIKKARQHPESPWSAALLADPRLPEIERNYTPVASEFPDPKHWAGGGKTFRAVAKELGLAADYDFLYGWLSERVHGSVLAIGEMFRQVQGTDRIEVLLKDEASVNQALFIAVAWVILIMQLHDESCKLGMRRTIDEFLPQLREVE